MAGPTLDELEGFVWGEPNFDSYLVTTCCRLRTKPIDEFTVEDLRIMIGQQISLPHLIPIAAKVLEKEPLAEGNYYPCDLLNAVIDVKREWLVSNGWIPTLVCVVQQALVRLEDEEYEDRLSSLKESLNNFARRSESSQ
jgi:hypothetical protein